MSGERRSGPVSGATAGDPRPPYEEIIGFACRAPSVHNTQPWLWRLRGDRVDLIADRSRQVVHADPDGRDLMLSCGAALHHLQVAAAGLGWHTRVVRCPDSEDQHLLASASFQPSHNTSSHGADLLSALTTRRTDRRRYTSWPLPAERLLSLAATGTLWGAQVLPVDSEAVRRRLERLTLHAARVQQADPGYVEELTFWSQGVRDGVTPDVLPTTYATGEAPSGLSREFPPGVLDDPVLDDGPPAEGMLIVCTQVDDVVSRLQAGEAMSAVWLQATLEGLSVVPLSQVFEVAETRHEVRAGLLDDLVCPQILLRVGWLSGDRSELPPTPRRSLEDVLQRDP